MSNGVMIRAWSWGGAGRPKVACLVIAKVDGFTTDIANRIVVPRSQTVLVTVFRPGICAACFRDDGTKLGIGNNIDPWCRGGLTRSEVRNVLATILRKATQSVKESQMVV